MLDRKDELAGLALLLDAPENRPQALQAFFSEVKVDFKNFFQDKKRLKPQAIKKLQDYIQFEKKSSDQKARATKARLIEKSVSEQLLTNLAYVYDNSAAQKVENHKSIYGNATLVSEYKPKVISEKKLEKERENKHNEITIQPAEQTKKFQQQFFALVDKINEWGDGVHINNINQLKQNIFSESYSSHQASEYFEAIKINLEKFYLLLTNNNISIEIRRTEYANLCQNFSVCSPGLYVHIENAYNQLESHISMSFNRWLAQFRTNLISAFANKLHDKRYPLSKNDPKRAGNELHTLNGLLLYAEKKGWQSLSNIQSNPDNFIVTSEISPKDYQNFIEEIDKQYTLASICDYVISKIQELLDTKCEGLGFTRDSNYWVQYNADIYACLQNILGKIFGITVPVYQLCEFIESKGDPARSYLRLNFDEIYQAILKVGIEQKIFFPEHIKLQSLCIDNEYYLTSYFLPLPLDYEVNLNGLYHWAWLSDDRQDKLLSYIDDKVSVIEKSLVTDFYTKLFKHANINRKIKSMTRLMRSKILSAEDYLEIIDGIPLDVRSFLPTNVHCVISPFEYLDDKESSLVLQKLVIPRISDVKVEDFFLKKQSHVSFYFGDLVVHAVQADKPIFLTIILNHIKTFDLNLLTFPYKTERQTCRRPVQFIAAIYGSYKCMQLLVEEYKIDLNKLNTKKQTVYHVAAMNNREMTLQYLLKQKVNLIPDEKSYALTILDEAIKNSAWDAVDVILQYCNMLGKSERIRFINYFSNGKNCLHYAVEKDNGKLIAKLIHSGVDVNRGDPIRLAFNDKKYAALRILAEHLAVNENAQALLLDEKSAPESVNSVNALIGLSIEEDKVTELEILFNAGIRPKPQMPYNMSYLMQALGKPKCLDFLIKNKVELNEKTILHDLDYNITLLDYAFIHKDKSLVLKILSAGADITNQLSNGDYPIHAIISWGDVDVLACLIKKYHTDFLSQKNKSGESAFEMIINSGRFDLLNQLTAVGVNFDSKRNPEPFLQQAISHQKIRSVRLIMRLGNVDVNAVHADCKTLLTQARELMNINTSKIIVPGSEPLLKVGNTVYNVVSLSKTVFNIVNNCYLTSLAYIPERSHYKKNTIALMESDSLSYSWLHCYLASGRTEFFLHKNPVTQAQLKNLAYSYGYNPTFTEAELKISAVCDAKSQYLMDMFGEERIDKFADKYNPNYIITHLVSKIYEQLIFLTRDCKQDLALFEKVAPLYLKESLALPIDIKKVYQLVKGQSLTINLNFNENYLNDLLVEFLIKMGIFKPSIRNDLIFCKRNYFKSAFFPVSVDKIDAWRRLSESNLCDLLEFFQASSEYLTCKIGSINFKNISDFYERLFLNMIANNKLMALSIVNWKFNSLHLVRLLDSVVDEKLQIALDFVLRLATDFIKNDQKFNASIAKKIAVRGDDNMIRQLHLAQVSFAAVDELQSTPLMAAVSKNNHLVIMEMLKYDCNLSQRDAKGDSVLEHAQRTENEKTIEIITAAILTLPKQQIMHSTPALFKTLVQAASVDRHDGLKKTNLMISKK